MIEKIKKKGISLGVGTTANCNLSCGHCYSKPLRGESLTLDDILLLIEGKGVRSINFGTGENILNPEFPEIVDECYKKGIKLSLTSNGYSIVVLSDEQMKKFNDVDISLDFSDKKEQNLFRRGNSWDFANEAIKKCKRLGIEFSITTALMDINYKGIPKILDRVTKEGCNLRVNIFKPVPKAGIYQFQLSYDQFWEAMSLLFSNGQLISCSEPIVNAVLGIPPIVPESPCGKESLRIHPDREVMPCVYWVNGDQDGLLRDKEGKLIEVPGKGIMPAHYWTKSKVTIDNLAASFDPAFENESFQRIRTVPKYCLDNCDKVEICGGGCASRRYLNGILNEPDMYCPIFHKKEIPKIKVTHSKSAKNLIHSSYLCTLIFKGKR